MTQEELNEAVRLHGMWLRGEEGGKRAILDNENLEKLSLNRASLNRASLNGASLNGASLNCASLNGASLNCANLDYSVLPLWCGSLSAHFDDRQLKQIAYHLVKAGLNSNNASEETKNELAKLIDFANGFHRAGECGLITATTEKECGKEKCLWTK